MRKTKAEKIGLDEGLKNGLAIGVRNLSKTFLTASGKKHALRNISLEIFCGECVVIGGENGSGKSVLMSIIAGLMDGDGDVSATLADSSDFSAGKPEDEAEKSAEKSDDPAGKSGVSVFGRVGLVFQEAETQILGETPREDVAFGPKNLGWKREQISEAVADALAQTGLAEKADFPARFLSGGEKRRLAVACMLAMRLPIIILDEPYANLDFGGVKQVNSLVRRLKSEGKTVIILSHELEKCLALADRFVVLFRGEKVFDGTPGDGLKNNLEAWNIRNPLAAYNCPEDLVWE